MIAPMKAMLRCMKEVEPRLMRRCAWNLGWNGIRSVRRFEKNRKRGIVSPAFGFISVTSRCNLRCQGCWVATDSDMEMPPEKLKATITSMRQSGVRFFGILGGEPLMYGALFDVLAQFPDCYFQIFTNGTHLNDAVAARMNALGNITPLISIEGDQIVSDSRRGGQGVYNSALKALEACRKARLLTGVATSVCKSNIDTLATEGFARKLVELGVHYMWYYIYRPVGTNPTPDLALTAEQIVDLRRFMVDLRCKVPIMVVDAYWDHKGRALCPAATGLTHHINPAGDIEPCPPIQFACDRIEDGTDAVEKMRDSEFLAEFRKCAASTTRGCILLEDPEALWRLVHSKGARDSSGRGTAHSELAAMRPLPGHNQPGQEIAERSWPYRFAKRNWFFGFGAYG